MEQRAMEEQDWEAMAPKWAEAAQRKKKCGTRCENWISLKQHDKN
jgi:hypothetical protein